MELEEMKDTWQKISKCAKKEELHTQQLVEKMTQQKYTSKLNKIGYSEYAGTMICYTGAAYLIVNFTKIEDVRIRVFAIFSIVLLFALPVISLMSLRVFKRDYIASKTYLEVINDFGKRKIRFQKFQKLNVSLGLFLLLTGIPVLSAIQGKDPEQIPYFWALIFPISIVFFLGFAFWVLRYYNRLLNETEKMLSDNNN